MSLVAVVIVNWNSGNQLRDCLKSLHPHSRSIASVIVVDNGSTDGSAARLAAPSLSLTVLRNSRNRGFAAACNQGAALAKCEYLLFLNPDTRLFANSLEVPLAFMELNGSADVGICGIQLVDDSGRVARTCARFPSLRSYAVGALGLDKLPQLRFLGIHMSDWDHSTTRGVDHVMGAFYLVRRAVFQSLSGFDERFFVYLEDLDMSLRAHREGWRTVYLAQARAFHAGGGTSRQVRAIRLFYSLRSRLLFGFKHFSRVNAWALLLITTLVEPFSRLLHALVRCSWRDAVYTLYGYSMLLTAFPEILRFSRKGRTGIVELPKGRGTTGYRR